MKLKTLFTYIALISCTILISQNSDFPQGLYYSFDEIQNKQPSKIDSLEVMERSTHTIKMNGGNDYELNSVDKAFKRSELKKLVYAYSDGEFLYLNCFILELQPWYAKVISSGNSYFVFKGALPRDPSKYGLDINNLGVLFGPIGGGLGGMKLAMLRYPYIMNKTTKEIVLVSDRNIRDFINERPELLQQYESEPNKKDVNVILAYLVKWNDRK